MCAAWKPAGSLPSALARPFPAGLAASLFTVPRPFRVGGHPPASFSSPSAFSSNRLPSVLAELPALADLPACDVHPVCQKAPPLGFSPSSRLQSGQLERGLPLPRSDSSPGCPGWNPPLRTLRPRRFARPRRFLPLPTLRACFIPLPRSGFRSPGVFLPTRSRASFPWPLPSCRSSVEPAV